MPASKRRCWQAHPALFQIRRRSRLTGSCPLAGTVRFRWRQGFDLSENAVRHAGVRRRRLKVSGYGWDQAIQYSFGIRPANFRCHDVEVRRDGKPMPRFASLESPALYVALSG